MVWARVRITWIRDMARVWATWVRVMAMGLATWVRAMARVFLPGLGLGLVLGLEYEALKHNQHGSLTLK